MEAVKNYKAMKTATKVSIAKNENGSIKVTKKQYDADSGEATNDLVENIFLDFITSRISEINTITTNLASEKAELEQFKTDAEAL